VFVTGGTGYIGSRVVARLIADGLEVRALCRSMSGQRRLEQMGVGFAQLGSTQFFAPMRQAIHECRSAVHLAGALTEARGNRFNLVNTAAGGMFARVAKEQGVAKAVLVTCVGTEASARIRSQRAAEQSLREAGVPYTVLRLAPVYGPESRLTAWLASFAGSGQLAASGSASWRPLHVDDAVEAILRVLDPDVAANETVEVAGGEALSLRSFAQRLGGGTGNGQRTSRGLAGLRRRAPDAAAALPPADLEMPMDSGTAGAERLGLTPRSLADGLA
jgi:nucleoside-diphosphate-sugar epimerase